MPEDLDGQLAELGRRGHKALVAGAIRDGECVVSRWAAAGEAPDARAVFEIGSITKVFTGVLLADMCLRGEVALEDTLSQHSHGPHPAWRHREPTLLELATHRSGLPNTPRGMGRHELAFSLGFGDRDPWADLDRSRYGRLVARESPRRAPNKRVRYSSMAVGLLGDALATRAGRPYEELVADRVLVPLGMDSTGTTVPPQASVRLLPGHSRTGRPRPPLEDFMPAAGSLRSSAEDMLRFLAACLDPPAGGPGPAIALAQEAHGRIGRRAEVGLGWMIAKPPRRPEVIWHNGGTWGFRSFAGFAPERRSAAVILSNTARSVDRLGFRLAEERGSGD